MYWIISVTYQTNICRKLFTVHTVHYSWSHIHIPTLNTSNLDDLIMKSRKRLLSAVIKISLSLSSLSQKNSSFIELQRAKSALFLIPYRYTVCTEKGYCQQFFRSVDQLAPDYQSHLLQNCSLHLTFLHVKYKNTPTFHFNHSLIAREW